LITIHGKVVDTQGVDNTVCENPDDNKFIERAIASDTKVIVSVDKHLLRINGYKGTTVLKPREFLETCFG